MSDKLNNLDDLLKHQIKDLYSAESQIIGALPKMINNATNQKLKDAFSTHLKQTEEQKVRLEQVCDILGIKPGGEKCKAMEGIIKEAASFMDEKATEAVMDAGMIAEAQRVEHYEITGYGTAHRYAVQLGYTEVADLLAATLEEEKDTDELLTDLAIETINVKAENA